MELSRLTDSVETALSTDDGCIDTELAVSRDGVNWQRVGDRDRNKFLTLGEKGTWQDSMVRSAAKYIVRDDKIYIYHGGVNGPHGGPNFPANTIVRTHTPAVGLATLRRDGFVSLDADDQGGTLVTRPMNVTAPTLHLNANTRNGFIDIHLPDSAGQAPLRRP